MFLSSPVRKVKKPEDEQYRRLTVGEAIRRESDALHKKHGWQIEPLRDAYDLDGKAYRRKDERSGMTDERCSCGRDVQTGNLSSWSIR